MLLDSNAATFKKQFNNQLSKMLSPDELGSFILVLFNSMQDEQLQNALAPELQTRFETIRKKSDLNATPDDLAVFDVLKNTGVSQYTAWKTRRVENWQCAYNPLRALRPERASKEIFTGLHKPFDECTFHFSKAFLRPEIISQETFNGTNLQIMYHKFPFAPYHLLIVIEATRHHAQFLNQATHKLAWDLTAHVAKTISGYTSSYNSLGAGASVNHLHIHGFVDEKPMAVEQPIWIHNGGNRNYPLVCHRIDSAEQSWDLIANLHEKQQPYNILYRPGVCYVLPRLAQGTRNLPAWLASIGWYEACGGFNLPDKIIYESLNADEIAAGLSILKV